RRPGDGSARVVGSRRPRPLTEVSWRRSRCRGWPSAPPAAHYELDTGAADERGAHRWSRRWRSRMPVMLDVKTWVLVEHDGLCGRLQRSDAPALPPRSGWRHIACCFSNRFGRVLSSKTTVAAHSSVGFTDR